MRRIETKHHPLAAAAIAALAVIACLATACSNDDARDPAVGADPTTQPLIFSATVATPTTAVATPTSRANTAAGQWTDGDVVAVEMDGVVKKYIVKAAAGAGATATLSPADEANTHYWPGETASVRAWRYGGYGNYAWDRKPDSWSVSTSQIAYPGADSFYQQSDFLYAPAQTLTYASQQGAASTGLTFYHQTARVEVRIREAGVLTDNDIVEFNVALGQAPGFRREMKTKAAFDPSLINPVAGQYSGLTANNSELDVITMKRMSARPDGYAHCYEALVIPQNMDGQHLICIRLARINSTDYEYYYYTPKPGEANLQGGYTYTYDITVSEHGRLDVSVGTPIVGWEQQEGGSGTAVLSPTLIDLANPQTISDDGAYLMTGTNHNNNILNITGGSPLVIVRDLNFTGSIHITGGTPEIRVEGTNNRISILGNGNPAIWLEGDNANVHVTGGGVTESRLELGSWEEQTAIGTKGTLGKADFRCGNISISNLTLSATVQNSGAPIDVGGAAIGTGGGEGNRKCGDITITDASVIAKSSIDAAAIGFGGADPYTDMTDITYEMGNITITNSTIESTIVPINGTPAHIGSGAKMAENYIIGEIRITTDKSGTEFFEKFNGGTKAGDEVIVGFPGAAKPWNVLWRTDLLMSILWDNVPGLLQLP